MQSFNFAKTFPVDVISGRIEESIIYHEKSIGQGSPSFVHKYAYIN